MCRCGMFSVNVVIPLCVFQLNNTNSHCFKALALVTKI